MVYTYHYIKPEWRDTIKAYKYNGEDHSIFHNYVSNPLCDYLVQYFPIWMA